MYILWDSPIEEGREWQVTSYLRQWTQLIRLHGQGGRTSATIFLSWNVVVLARLEPPVQSDQLSPIGADMTSATSLSLSIFHLLLYGLPRAITILLYFSLSEVLVKAMSNKEKMTAYYSYNKSNYREVFIACFYKITTSNIWKKLNTFSCWNYLRLINKYIGILEKYQEKNELPHFKNMFFSSIKIKKSELDPSRYYKEKKSPFVNSNLINWFKMVHCSLIDHYIQISFVTVRIKSIWKPASSKDFVCALFGMFE